MNDDTPSHRDLLPPIGSRAAMLPRPRPRLARRKKSWPGPTLHRPLLVRRVPALARVTLWACCKGFAGRLWRPFPICRIAGVPVQFHSTFLLHPIGTVLWFGSSGHHWRNLWPLLLLLSMACLSLLAHEFAHILAARRCGIGTQRMIFLPVGAVALLDDIPRMAQEIWVALAGPLASLALAGLCQLAVWAMQHGLHGLPFRFLHDHAWLFSVMRLLRLGCYLNLGLALFNLLPCYPMDGGRVLRSLLAVALGRFTRRTRDAAFLLATKIVVRGVAWPLAFGALTLTIARTHLWPHLILFPLLLVFGELEYRMLREECPEPIWRRRPVL